MNEISLAEYRQQIEGAIEDGRYEEAVAHVRRILEAYPKDIDAYWLLGRAMLEAGQDERVVDMLRRVVSADPEHVLAWVGMSEVARRHGELEAAVWYLERAFELATDSEVVARELRRLYGELAGSEPERLQLTQGAMARLYLRGDLLTRAISELRGLLEEHPDRLDLKVALVEALWHDGQRLQASEVCQEILDGQPYNLKANLILGEIWESSGRTEGEFYLEHARALDPENQMAQELFGSASPLPPESPRIAPLDYAATPQEERPVPLADWRALRAPEPFALCDTGEVMEAPIEIPAWLEEIAGEGAREMPLAVEPFAEEAAAPAEEAVDEMIGEERAPIEEVSDEEIREWLRQLDEAEVPFEVEEEEEILPEALEEEEIPAWLADLGPEPPVGEAEFEAEEAVLLDEPQAVKIPDWLLDLAPPEAVPPETAPPEDEALAWLQQLAEGEVGDLPVEAEGDREELVAFEETAGLEGLEVAEELPPWLRSEDLPSAEEALGWLEQLVEAEEVERPPEAPVPAPEPAWEEVEEALAYDEAQLVEAMEEAPIEDLEGYIAARRAYAVEYPEDHEAWLDLGRVLWQADRRLETTETYDHLIASGELLDEIIPDLEDYVEQWPDVDMQRVLGDAYVKVDRLTDALAIYRRALASL